MLFYRNAVNIFTDASTKVINPGTPHQQFLTCPGFVTTINGTVINQGYNIVEATVNYAELYAIKMGVEDALKYKDTDLFLNIFSDSKISVFGLRKWFFKYYQNAVGYTLMTSGIGSKKKPVSNQELILDIVRMILHSNTKLSIYHIPGHIKTNKIDSMNKFHEVFHANNFPDTQKITTTLDIEIDIAKYNDYIDNYTRSKLNRTINLGELKNFDTRKKNYPVVWYPNPKEVKDYLYLINV